MRATQRYLVALNLCIFGAVLSIILFLNLAGSSEDRTFQWQTIRYQAPSGALKESKGSCPGLSASKEPALVVAHVESDGDPKWLENFASLYHLCLYDVNQGGTLPGGLAVPANRGHEAMAYLTFIIDNYDTIPDAGAVFIHGSRFAWHNDSPKYDNAELLNALNVTAALEPYGYHNMRCDWSASTCDPSAAPAQGSLETVVKSKLQPWDIRAVSDAALVNALVSLFGNDTAKDVKPARTHAIRSQCCAQFVVSRERIRQHARSEYIAIRHWLLDNGKTGAPQDDLIAGRVLSYIWHILFMKDSDGTINLKALNSKACPSAPECYCRLYGRCNLSQCTAARCPGQYTIPPNYKVPATLRKPQPVAS